MILLTLYIIGVIFSIILQVIFLNYYYKTHGMKPRLKDWKSISSFIIGALLSWITVVIIGRIIDKI